MTAVRTYSAVDGGTDVEIKTVLRIPLATWLLQPVFRREVDYVQGETERRFRAHFDATTQYQTGAETDQV